MPDHARKRPQVCGNLRVACMRHRDAANRTRDKPLAHFINLWTLQIVNFMADLIAGGGNQREQVEPLGKRISRGQPRNRRSIQSKSGQESLLQFQRLWPERGKAAYSTCELSNVQPRRKLRQSLA